MMLLRYVVVIVDNKK